MYEIERKYKINNLRDLVMKLKPIARFIFEERQEDNVYLYNQKDFTNFKQGDAVLRIRSVGEANTLTLKKKKSDDHSLELETSIDNRLNTESIVRELGFKRVVKIKKVRKHYIIDETDVYLDYVDGLGTYLEIEVLSKRDNDKSAITKIKKIAKMLGLDESSLENKKYDELLLNK